MNKNIQEYLKYLDDLKDRGVSNVQAAAPYLKSKFPELTLNEAEDIISTWVRTRLLIE